MRDSKQNISQYCPSKAQNREMEKLRKSVHNAFNLSITEHKLFILKLKKDPCSEGPWPDSNPGTAAARVKPVNIDRPLYQLS